MKRLKGALKIYSKQDVAIIIFALATVLGIMISNFSKSNYNKEFCSDISMYLSVLTFLIVSDYISSFSSRYLMYSNFNNCRNLFYKSQVILILLKSIALTLILNLMIVLEIILCKIKNYNYVIEVLGIRVVNIHGIELVKLMILIFIATTVFWSISFVFSSIECFGFIMAIISCFAIWILTYMLFGSSKIIQSYSYLQVVSLSALLTLINFTVAWVIIKRKSQMGDSWFVKLSKAFYSNDNG